MQQKKGSKGHILEVARRLFGSRGFHQTSMAELATDANVSIGQIYRLFKGKEDIIEAIVAADADQWCAEMSAIRDRLDAREQTIETSFEQLLLHRLRDKDDALAFDILAESVRNPGVGATVGTMCERFRAFIRHFACAANPDLSGTRLDGAEEIVLSCLFGLGHRNVSRPRLDCTSTARQGATMILAALRAEGPSED